jgi:hypothetical protein
MSSRFANITYAAISSIGVKDQTCRDLDYNTIPDPVSPYRVSMTLKIGETSGMDVGFALSLKKAARLLRIVGIGGAHDASPRIITVQGENGAQNIGRLDEREEGGVFWMLPEHSRS